MSYLVLARKYRPKTFEEVAGQESVTRVLRGAIEEGRIGHAYLFTGPRGTGKTTSARLFAKALNCERGPTPRPCNACERCLALDRGAEADVLEIDAASNTGVDHVRDLRDQAGYVPLRARFKVFIVDEVHMLSKAAFNALLKTLEEPPPHVKFLFATTELHKVPDTILSRCQVLRLAPLSEAEIRARLEEIFQAEGIEAEEGVARDLARRARGGMRDALSLADQLLALVGSKPRLADCDRLASEGSSALIELLVERMIAGDPAGTWSALPPVEGNEEELVAGLLEHLRACLVVALCGAQAPVVPGGPYDAPALAALGARAAALGARRLELWLQELIGARERMRVLPAQARVILEVTLLELCRADATLPLDELVARLEALEARLGSSPPPVSGAHSPERTRAGGPALAPPPPPRAAAAAPIAASAPSAPAAPSATAATPTETRPRVRTTSAADAWAGFLAELAETSPSLHEVVTRRGRLEALAGERAVVKLTGLAEDERVLLAERRNQRTCSRAFSQALGREIEVALEDAGRQRPGADDPFTREVAQLFEGRIEE